MVKVIDLEPKQELLIKVGESPIKLELRRGLAEVYGTEMLANKPYNFQRNSKASVFTYHGATIEMEGNPLKSHVSKNCDYMTCYLRIHQDLETKRDEAERLSEQFKFNTLGTSNKANNDQVSTQQEINPVGGGSESQLLQQQSPIDENTSKTPVPQDGEQPVPSTTPDLSKIPICLVCEPMDARNLGKSTLCRILLNYATRRGRAPIFVDLDPDQGHIGLPGSVGALSIESPIDIESGMSLRSSMLMHFGHTSPSADSESRSGLHYKALLESMALIVRTKLEQDKKSYHSGVIINTSSWSDTSEYKLLVHACKVFRANMVLVMDDEVLQDDLQKDLNIVPMAVNNKSDQAAQHQRVVVLNVPKTVEIYKSKAAESVELRYSKIREYFYGTRTESYNPHTSEVKFSFLKRLIYRVGNPLMLPDSLMPLGSKAQDAQIKVTPFDCTPADLLHHILAISYCKVEDVAEDSECILRTNLMGFICVTNVRSDSDTVSILTPQKLPNPMEHILLYSEVQYMDSLI